MCNSSLVPWETGVLSQTNIPACVVAAPWYSRAEESREPEPLVWIQTVLGKQWLQRLQIRSVGRQRGKDVVSQEVPCDSSWVLAAKIKFGVNLESRGLLNISGVTEGIYQLSLRDISP